jgi:predicted nuclease with TOPRIM domain
MIQGSHVSSADVYASYVTHEEFYTLKESAEKLQIENSALNERMIRLENQLQQLMFEHSALNESFD